MVESLIGISHLAYPFKGIRKCNSYLIGCATGRGNSGFCCLHSLKALIKLLLPDSWNSL